MTNYVLTVGEDDPEVMQDSLVVAQDRVNRVINKVVHEEWRRQALHNLVFHMPRAGISFTTDTGVLIKLERKEMVSG